MDALSGAGPTKRFIITVVLGAALFVGYVALSTKFFTDFPDGWDRLRVYINTRSVDGDAPSLEQMVVDKKPSVQTDD